MIFEPKVYVNEEAIYSKKYKNPVYIVLMHSGSPLASAIQKMTRDQFSHACISFNSNLDPLYSFGSKGKGDSGIGFSVTDPKDKFFTRYNSFYHVYVMYISDKALNAMRDRLEYFENNANKLKYDFLGLFDIWFNKPSEDHDHAWFCSRFVMELIQKVTPLSKVPSLWKPSDIADLDNISLVNRGFDFYNYNPNITKRHCNSIKMKKYKPSDVVYEDISSSIEKDNNSNQKLKLSVFHRMTLNDMIIRVHIKRYPQLSNIRINRYTKGYVWIDGSNQNLVALINTQEKDDDYKWIISFEIFGEYKGKGLSKQILDVAVKQLGITHLSVNKSNDIAIKVYKSYGFKKYKENDTVYFMTISKYADIHEEYDNLDKYKYPIDGNSEDLKLSYEREYSSDYIYPYYLKVGLPYYVDIDILESIVWDKSDKIMKRRGRVNPNKDYPFKFYRQLNIAPKEITNMLQKYKKGILYNVKIYHYNFQKKNRRFSVILIADKTTVYAGYIIVMNYLNTTHCELENIDISTL